MNKRQIVREVSLNTGLSQVNITKVINGTIEVIIKNLQEDKKITFNKFGLFYTKELGWGKGRNIITGEEMVIKPRKRIKFIPSKTIKLK